MKSEYLYPAEEVTGETPSIADPDFKGLLIGGGILRPSALGAENTANDMLEHAIDMTGEDDPNVLMIPSAKATLEAHDEYNEHLRGVFVDDLGAKFDVLHPHVLDHSVESADKPVNHELMPSRDELEDKIGKAALIFVAGGNTGKMLYEIWKPSEIDKMLLNKIDGKTVFSGISAGAIVWGEAGHSDSFNYETSGDYGEEDGWEYAAVRGLAMVRNTILIPHYDSKTTPTSQTREANTAEMLQEMANKSGKTVHAIGIDNRAAIEIQNGAWKPITSKAPDGRKSVVPLAFPPS